MRIDGAETLLGHLAKGRQLARTALVGARIEFERRDDDEAIEDVLAVMTLARHVSRDGTIIGLLLGYSIERDAIKVLAGYLPDLDPATLARDLNRMPSAHLLDLRAYDLFPQTSHVETVVVLGSHE